MIRQPWLRQIGDWRGLLLLNGHDTAAGWSNFERATAKFMRVSHRKDSRRANLCQKKATPDGVARKGSCCKEAA